MLFVSGCTYINIQSVCFRTSTLKDAMHIDYDVCSACTDVDESSPLRCPDCCFFIVQVVAYYAL